MINADEHKKLLAQITELEKNSVNYFDVDREFFLIDSNNLSQVRPRLYGYSIQRSGIYEDDDLTPEAIAGLDGRGCYVYVDVRDGKITIKQDLNGCWGIYLFRHGDYFALSNSFFRLLDYIKFRYPLTVNRDYCLEQMTQGLRTSTYSETAVNEIQLVDRSAILQVDITTKSLEIEQIDYKEYTVSLDSEEALTILDNWIDFWSSVLCGIAQHTKFIQADLSGGFDSRVAFVSLLNSGIDLNKIRINSVNSTFHTYKDDYAIASKIAEHYGFKLNQPLPARNFLNYSLADTWNIDLYHQQAVRSSPAMSWAKKNVDKLYHIKGMGGEGIRKYFPLSREELFHKQTRRAIHYSYTLSNELRHSIENILESVIQSGCDKYKMNEENIFPFLWIETACRHHFGKESLGGYLKNNISIAPILDPELRRVQLNTTECPDYNLLLSLIFARYAPELLTFPFDSKHSIEPETIEYARKINERFPRVKKDKQSISGGGLLFTAA